MIVFIDDSGDPGFKMNRGSSHHFVIALVIFDKAEHAEAVATRIKILRKELGWSEKAEFKFMKTKPEYKKRFFKEVTEGQFRIRSLVVDKEVLYGEKIKTDKRSFYAYFIKKALECNNGTIKGANIKIDGSGDRTFRRTFTSYLRRELNKGDTKVVEKISLVDSTSNVLIQLADMVAGAVHRSYCPEKSDYAEYKKIIKKHIEDEWEFQ